MYRQVKKQQLVDNPLTNLHLDLYLFSLLNEYRELKVLMKGLFIVGGIILGVVLTRNPSGT